LKWPNGHVKIFYYPQYFLNIYPLASICTFHILARKPTSEPDVNVKQRYGDDETIGQYSLTTLVIIISICSLTCIIITIVVAVVWHHKKTKSKKLNKDSKTGKSNDKYMPVNGFTTTGV
jgi:hypothetical protein